MHAVDNPQIRSVGSLATGSVARLFMRLGERLRRRQAIARLRALDDRLLADIGLSRPDIEMAVRFGRQADTTFGQVDRGIARDKLAQAANNEWKSAA